MKAIKSISALCLLAIVAVTFTACFKFDDPPKREPFTVDLAKVMTIADFKTEASRRGLPATFAFHPDSAQIFIRGQVISNDRDGNIYREFFIQDESGHGLRIKDGRRTSLYNFYRLGQTVYILTNGLTLGNNNGTLELGTRNRNFPHSSNFQIDFIEVQWLINRHIFQGVHGVPVEPDTVTLQQLNENLIGTLVRINGLTLVPSGIPTWANPNPGGGASPQSLSQNFTDGSSSQIIVRTSGFARFAGDTMPTEPVDIVGILTRFGTSGAARGYQLVLRDLNDVTKRP